MELKDGEKLAFRTGPNISCPEGRGTPLDCGQVLRPTDMLNLVCGLHGDGEFCPYHPKVKIVDKSDNGSHVSAETAGLPPLD
jgi:hypothetical protein